MKFFSSLLASLTLCLPAYSSVLLQIDVSNPSAVVFLATGAAPDVNDDSAAYMMGIYTTSFPTGADHTDILLSGDFGVAGGNTFSYLILDAYILAMVTPWDDSYMDFSTARPAFTGSSTADLSGVASYLPEIGHTGVVFAGEGIGTFGVIPEPSSVLMGVLGGAAALLGFRRRGKNA